MPTIRISTYVFLTCVSLLPTDGFNAPLVLFQVRQTKSVSSSLVPTVTIGGNAHSLLRSLSTDTEPDTQTETITGATTLMPTDENDVAEGDFQMIDGVICARGVCVLADEVAPEVCVFDEEVNGIVCQVNLDESKVVRPGLSLAYLWPRLVLLTCSILYGINFPLGRLMVESLPASAATSSRMVLATIALAPFLFKLKPNLRAPAALCGSFTALGYVSQSIALVDTPAATVSFLGALVVIVPPALSVIVDKKKMGFADAPQTWIAAITCLVGVGVLELGGNGEFGMGDMGWGDLWSILQAVGFGTSFFITERMMAKEPSQALPITAMQCGMTAVVAGIWATLDGNGAFGGALSFGSPYGAWLLDQDVASKFTLPGLFLDLDYRNVALAGAFTGFITTAANRVGETMALGKLSSSEASVLLATEPLWAAFFATFLIGEQLSLWDGLGGALIVVACVATALDPAWLRQVFQIDYEAD